MSRKTVSAILPNYNYASYFTARLDSVLNQSYKISQLIILDDCSTDNSINLIKDNLSKVRDSFPEIEIFFKKNPKNSGSVFAQWQRGIRLATSDYFWIAELDDSCSSDFLRTAIEPVLTDESIVLSYTNSRLIGDVTLKDKARCVLDLVREHRLPKSFVEDGQVVLNRSLAVYNTIPNVSGCVIKNNPDFASILDEAKGYRLSGDWYFYMQLARLGKIAYSPKKLNYHRLSKVSVTNTTSNQERLAETKKLHDWAIENLGLELSTIHRIKRLEKKLEKNWS